VFPLLVLLVFATLVALDISGSSIGYLSADPRGNGLLFGTPRGIRSDEWIHTTPLRISASLQSFPSEMWVGLSRVDQSGPQGSMITLDWPTLLRPDNWGFLLLDGSRGLAWAWWWSPAVGLWGVYALIGLITRRPLLSAALAIIATFTPYSAWWSNGPAIFVGYGAGACALMLAAWQARRTWQALLAAIGTGLVGAMFALMLYPAWQVPIVWVMALTAIGLAVDRRLGWRRTLWTGALGVGIAVGLIVLWYLQHRPAITALAGTYYPGRRASSSSGARLELFLSAPLNPWLARGPGDTLQAPNLSESASTWLPLAVLVLLIAGTAWLAITAIRRPRTSVVESGKLPIWSLVLLSSALLLLLAWAFLPMPSWIGSITFLNLSPPSRTQVGLGLGLVVLLAIATTVKPRPAIWGWPAALVASLLSSALTLWSASQLAWDLSRVPLALVALSGLVVGAGFALTLTCRKWREVPALVLAAYAVVSCALVNPVQLGIAPLRSDPAVVALSDVARDSGNPRVAVFGTTTDFRTVALLRAAGLQPISGWTPYPDSEVMTRLAPEQESDWNNYAQYAWRAAPPGSGMRITSASEQAPTLNWIDVDPCMPALLDVVDPGWVISEIALDDATCLLDIAEDLGASGTHIYRVR